MKHKNFRFVTVLSVFTALVTNFLWPGLSHASTSSYNNSLRGMNIYWDGYLASSPKGIYAVDPSTGKDTTYMPIWYVMRALDAAAVQSTWDGSNWGITLPENLEPRFQPNQVPANLGLGSVLVWIDGKLVQRDRAIRFPDPASHVLTTYVPVWYVGVALHYFGVESSWDGVNWRMMETAPGTIIPGDGWVSSLPNLGNVTGTVGNAVGGVTNALSNTVGSAASPLSNAIGGISNTVSSTLVN